MLQIATVLTTVAVLLGGGMAVPAGAGNPDLGRIWAKDKVLKRGCHNYRYQYKVTPRGYDWSLETYLRDPTGEIIASNALDSFVDRRRGSSTFRFCRYATRPGTFKIRGKLTLYDGYDQHVGWVRPDFFRMRLRR
jgi:hypothetical protein